MILFFYFLFLCCRLDMQSAEFSSQLQPFLHEHTEAFVRELLSFAQSPFLMSGYDSACIYDSLHGGSSEGATERALRGKLPCLLGF